MGKTNADDLLTRVFAILIHVTPTIQVQNSLLFHKNWQTVT